MKDSAINSSKKVVKINITDIVTTKAAFSSVAAVSVAALFVARGPALASFISESSLIRIICTVLLGLVSLLAIVILTVVVSTMLLTKPKKPWVEAGDFLSNFSWDGERPLEILFMTWGSRGDVQPNVALGLEFARRGHKVKVMGMECFRSVVEVHPELTYVPCCDRHMFNFASSLLEPGNESKLPTLCAKLVDDSFSELLSQYMEAAKDADVLFGQYLPSCLLQQFTVAQALKKPLFYTLHDGLSSLPNAQWSFDPSTNRIRDHGWLSNILNTRALPIIVGLLSTISPWSQVRSCRRKLGLSTRWPFIEFLGPRNAASIPTFCTWDPTLWPRPKDYSPHWFTTGFLVTKANKVEDNDFVMDWAEKRAKQEPDRKLIYAALGSFGHHNKKLYTDLLLDAADKLKLDVVTLEPAVDDRVMPPNVLVAKEVPQSVLFPKCALVVHHGGSGTAQQVIRSGRPGVCVPAMHFQEHWGDRIREYGAGLMVTLPELTETYNNFGENKLLETFQAVMQPEIKLKAKELGEAARRAGGVEMAADKMLEYLHEVAK